jgi:hypothetical protein
MMVIKTRPGPINGLSPEALIPVSAWGFVGKFRS